MIFDFYGTLAHWEDRHHADYPAAFARHGYSVATDIFDAYFTEYDGIEHREHSASADVYEAWVRARLDLLAERCGVPATARGAVVDDLRMLDQSPMRPYPEAVATLRALRSEGWVLAVCSNWGWELEPFLHQVGVMEHLEVALTSAREGARKPHPSIYARAVEVLGVDASDAVFVGDSWGPDVVGPCRAGMRAVHVWRPEERAGASPPELPARAHRIAALDELPALLGRLREEEVVLRTS